MTEPAATPPPASTPEDVPSPLIGLGLPPFIKRVRGLGGATGMGPATLAGAPGGGAGLGGGGAWGGGGFGDGATKIPNMWQFLEMGSPRLALARALGVPFAPWMVSCTAEFTSASPSTQPNIGADTKFSQDQWIDAAIARVTSQNTPTNQFDTMSDFFQNWQNAFKCRLAVGGAPRFDVIPEYTRLSTAFDVTNPRWLGSWIVTYDQQLIMDFTSTFPLAVDSLPLEIQCTFRCWGPIGEMFTKMTADEAFMRLARDFGIECNDAFMRFHCR